MLTLKSKRATPALAFLVITGFTAAAASGSGNRSIELLPASTPLAAVVTSVTDSTIAISWTALSDNVGVAGYRVYANGSLATTTTATSYTLAGVPCGGSVDFAVEAFDAAGNHSGQTTVSGTTSPCAPPPDHSAPSTPASLSASASHTTISLSWAPSSDNVGVAGYDIYLNGAGPISTSSTNYTFTGLSCATSYTIAVDAFNAAGKRSAQATLTQMTAACPVADPVPPPPPTGPDVLPPTLPSDVSVSARSTTGIYVQWGASSDNVGVAGYGVYSNGTGIASTISTTYTYSTLTCGTTYNLSVDAYDAAGNRSGRASLAASTAPCAEPSAGLYVSPFGSDTNTCSASSPCLSLNRAYQAASPGQTVEIAAGSYPYQQIGYDPAKSGSGRVVFRPAAGASVSFSQVDLGQAQYMVAGPQHLALQDVNVGNLTVWDGSQDIRLQNLSGKSFDVLSYSGTSFGPASNISVVGGNFGPCQAPRDGACTERLIGSNISVDGTSIHDNTSTDLVNNHVDGIFVRGCSSCTIKNNSFYGNMITDIRVQNCCSLPANSNLTISNNWFGITTNGDGSTREDAIDLDTPTPSLQITSNIFQPGSGPLFTDGAWAGTNTQVSNNEMLLFPCQAGISYKKNTVKPAFLIVTRCDPTDTVAIVDWLWSPPR